MKKFKIMGLIVIGIVVLFVMTSFLSFIFAGKILFVDSVLGVGEKEILEYFGDYEIGELPGNKTHISLFEIEDYLSALRLGDLVFTGGNYHMSSLLIDGKWKHSLIYIGKENEVIEQFGENSSEYEILKPYYDRGIKYLIIDSTRDGVQIRNLFSLANVKNKSYMNSIVAFRIRDGIKNKKSLSSVMEHIGKPYDYDLSIDNDKWYCSELVYLGLLNSGINVNLKSDYIIRKMILPRDIVNYAFDSDQFSFLFFVEKKGENFRNYSKSNFVKI